MKTLSKKEMETFYNRFGKHGIWNNAPEFPRQDWREQISSNQTNLGYWEWVQHQMEDANLVFCDVNGKNVDAIIVITEDTGEFRIIGEREGQAFQLKGNPTGLSVEALEEHIGSERFFEFEDITSPGFFWGPTGHPCCRFDVRETNRLYAAIPTSPESTKIDFAKNKNPEKDNLLAEVHLLKDEIKISEDNQHLLGEALCKVLIADGVLGDDAIPSGPELLAAAENYISFRENENDDAPTP